MPGPSWPCAHMTRILKRHRARRGVFATRRPCRTSRLMCSAPWLQPPPPLPSKFTSNARVPQGSATPRCHILNFSAWCMNHKFAPPMRRPAHQSVTSPGDSQRLCCFRRAHLQNQPRPMAGISSARTARILAFAAPSRSNPPPQTQSDALRQTL